MNGIKQVGFLILALLLATVLATPQVFADPYDKDNLNVNSKAFFDVSLGGMPLLDQMYDPHVADSMLLTSYLMVINETYETLVAQQDSNVRFVIAFRGPALQFLLKAAPDEDDASALFPSVASVLEDLATKNGVQLLVCERTIASHKNMMEMLGVEGDVFLLDSIAVTANTFISSMFYQQRNYAVIQIN